jgi:hypothetical protein
LTAPGSSFLCAVFGVFEIWLLTAFSLAVNGQVFTFYSLKRVQDGFRPFGFIFAVAVNGVCTANGGTCDGSTITVAEVDALISLCPESNLKRAGRSPDGFLVKCIFLVEDAMLAYMAFSHFKTVLIII